jgi:hypothetical protein
VLVTTLDRMVGVFRHISVFIRFSNDWVFQAAPKLFDLVFASMLRFIALIDYYDCAFYTPY